MRLFKTLAVFTALFISACSIQVSAGSTDAGAGKFETCSVSYIQSVSEMPDVPAGYTAEAVVSGSGKNIITSYFRFTLDSDSWVCLSGNYSMYSHDGAGTHVDIFYDSSLGKKAGDFGWGYWQYKKEFKGFLPYGTYYASVTTKKENYRDAFTGNVNVTVAAVPVSTVFDFTVEAGKKMDYAQISVPDKLGSHIKSVQYRKGVLDSAHVDDGRYWKKRAAGSPDDAFILTADSGCYPFRVSENGPYTVMVEDTGGSRYSAVINISCIDQTKPSVTGVKNGKAYKKAVTVWFSDKQSGIRSAVLNGRKISSGKKVKAAGIYRLAVTDRAGNKTSIKFRIRK